MVTLRRRARTAGGAFALVELDLTAPASAPVGDRDVQLGPAEHGVGVVARWHGRPVGFALRPGRPGERVPAAELVDLVAADAAPAILDERLRAQVGAEIPPDLATTVSVVICTRDRPELLARCLASLRRSLAAAEAAGAPATQVVVVDNAPSDDRTLEATEADAGVDYVREPKAGLDFARNTGWRRATGEVVAYLDDDVVVEQGWALGLRQALAEHPDAGAVTGLVLPFELTTPAQVTFEAEGGFRRGFRPLRYEGDTAPGNPLFPTGAGIFGAGCNMAIRRDVLERLGGFDEALDTGPPLPGGGDLDIFYRVVRGGWPLVYEPLAAVRHQHRRDHRGLRRQYWSWGEGFMAYVTKHAAADRRMRLRFVRLVQWWTRHQAGQLVAAARGRSPRSVDLAAAELAGGVVGLLGSYARSQRRTARIRERAA